jgi:hypothetical protein
VARKSLAAKILTAAPADQLYREFRRTDIEGGTVLFDCVLLRFKVRNFDQIGYKSRGHATAPMGGTVRLIIGKCPGQDF